MTNWRAACNNGSCLQAALLPSGQIGLRNSRAPEVTITTTPQEWAAFVVGIKAGELDDIGRQP